MENSGFVRNGMMRLPPGFRFHPTDEELVVQYLRRKVYSCPLPASIIPEIDLGKYDPWDLPGAKEQERYFFNLREAKYPKGGRSNRAASSGYWKATGRDKAIVSPRCNQVLGMKKVLVFYKGKPPHGTKTNWIMHEYRLADAGAGASPAAQSDKVPSRRDWVLCRIFTKKRATRMDAEDSEHRYGGARVRSNGTGLIDFFRQRDDAEARLSSSSESSCVTELSDGCSSGEETTSCSSNGSSSCGRDTV